MLKPCSVLVVDDNSTNRRILHTQLKAWGMTPTSVPSGRETLETLSSNSFDVVLVDLQMPEMDGITLAREIRKKTKAPLILLSSLGEVEIGEEASLFACQIPKPIKQSLLWDALQEVTGGAPRTAPKTAVKRFDHSMANRKPLRILLAEDNAVNQKVGRMMLGNLGYRAELASNGLQVLDAVFKVKYDLIFMDIQMPEMDGVMTTQALRERIGKQCPFIVALTANALEGDREKFLGLGFDGYLSKPLSPESLQAILASVPIRNGTPPTADELA